MLAFAGDRGLPYIPPFLLLFTISYAPLRRLLYYYPSFACAVYDYDEVKYNMNQASVGE
jgi:hypothetical protein